MGITALANVWRKVEGVMGDRRISCKRRGNMLNSCITSAFMNALDTMALTEKQAGKVQVCENNLIINIVGVKRRMDELRMEV